MLYNFGGAGAEAPAGADGVGEGPNEHIDTEGVDVLVLCDAAAGAAEDAEGVSFVEDEAVFEALFEFDLGGGGLVLWVV